MGATHVAGEHVLVAHHDAAPAVGADRLERGAGGDDVHVLGQVVDRVGVEPHDELLVLGHPQLLAPAPLAAARAVAVLHLGVVALAKPSPRRLAAVAARDLLGEHHGVGDAHLQRGDRLVVPAG